MGTTARSRQALPDTKDPLNRTDKIVRLVGTSTTSWEDATRAAVNEAAKTIRDLSRAAVTELDTVVRDGQIVQYRAKIEVAFQLDRTRLDSSGISIQTHRYLVVGNNTLSSSGLDQVVRERLAEGPAEFHVLVPCTPIRGADHSPLAVGDPLTGYIDPGAIVTSDLDDDAADRARDRLADFTEHLTRLGADVTGEIGSSDPLRAVQQVLSRSDFDEIIVSTLPGRASRWVRMDLTTRLRRSTHLPVTHLEVDGAMRT